MRINRSHRLARKTAPRTSVVVCPHCGSQPGVECKRIDGKAGRPHRERVLAFEQNEAQIR